MAQALPQPDLRRQDLQLLLAIAETGGVTQAQTRLGMSQSAISHALAGLESRAGLRLFDRLRRRLRLSAAGDELLQHARAIERAFQAAEHLLQQHAGEPRRCIRLSTQCYTNYHWLPEVLRTHAESHPRTELRVVAEATPRPFAALAAGEIDLAIIHTRGGDARFRFRRLFEDEVLLAVPPGHRLAARRYVLPGDLQGEALVDFPAPEGMNPALAEFLAGQPSPFARTSQLPLTDAIVALVRAGQGVAILSRWLFAPQLESGELIGVKLGRRGLGREWRAVSSAQTANEEELDALADTLAATVTGRLGLRATVRRGRARTRRQ